MGHCWSLSVEEHFYLLWPVVLYAGGVALGWRIGLGCLAVCWLIRCGVALGLAKYVFPVGSSWSDVSMSALMAESWTFTRLDTITMGSLLALCSRSQNGRAWLNRLTSAEMLCILFVTLCVSITLTQSSKYNLCVAFTLNGLCIALLMWGLIQSQGLTRRILCHPVLRVIGMGSYSIYLWQQLFIYPRHAGWIHQFPQNIVLTMGAAFLSYWLVEQPMNRLKDRVAGGGIDSAPRNTNVPRSTGRHVPVRWTSHPQGGPAECAVEGWEAQTCRTAEITDPAVVGSSHIGTSTQRRSANDCNTASATA